MTEIYRSSNLCVRSFPGDDTSRWFVTFDHVGDNGDLDRDGFGSAYFRERGVSCISVVGRGNHWYQYSDMTRALYVIRHVLEGARVRIAYGSSMGGYAAIRFADRIEATACIAISPQYSVDPAKVPFERRWLQEGRRIRWYAELDGPIRSRIVPIVVFDPRGDDRRHVALIATDTRITPIAIPHGGHPVSTYLVAAGLLTGLVDGVHQGNFDPLLFQNVARARRKSIPAWIAELANRQPPHRLGLAERLAREAVRQLPDAELLIHILARILTARGKHREALELHGRVYAMTDRGMVYGLPYSWALAQAGFRDDALALAIDLHGRYPGNIRLSDWLAELHACTGTLAEAVEQAAAAIDRFPQQREARTAHHQILLKRYRDSRRRSLWHAARSWWRALWNPRIAGKSGPSCDGPAGLTVV